MKKEFSLVSSIAGTVIYLIAPYRFSNIFVRAAIGDATSFIFLPLIFLALYQIRISKKLNWKWIAFGAVFLSCALLSHAMVFFFIILAYWFYVIYWGVILKNIKEFVFSSVLSFLLFIGLSSYYLLP